MRVLPYSYRTVLLDMPLHFTFSDTDVTQVALIISDGPRGPMLHSQSMAVISAILNSG